MIADGKQLFEWCTRVAIIYDHEIVFTWHTD